ncbi:hypothetical protein [Peribacillus simplex]|uniref:hypothetical protein n=1 Tax=Peribacillus simplex TaxID=1478 RepID=UPI003D29C750
MFFTVIQWIEEIGDTPAEKLTSRDPTGACFDVAWQTVGGKGADFRNQLEYSIRKKRMQLDFLEFVYSLRPIYYIMGLFLCWILFGRGRESTEHIQQFVGNPLIF